MTITSKKRQKKCYHSTFIAKRQKKGIIPTLDDHFVQEDWGEFQDKHFFSQVELSKLLLKAFGLQKGLISYPFLGDQ